MKKLSYLLGLFLVAGILFSSCSKDEDDDPQDLTPTIHFVGDAGYTSADVTINAGDDILVGVVANANGTSGKKLTNFTLILTTNNTPQTLVDSAFSEASFTADYSISFPDAGETRLAAKITDKDGQTKEIAFNITINDVTPTVATHTNIQLGSYNDDDLGSFYASTSNTVFKKADAANNQAMIDFAFFKGVSTQNSIGAPAANNVQTVFDIEIGGSNEWTTYNDTQIEMATIDEAEFDAIGVIYDFPELTEGTNEVNDLVTGDVLIFETVDGKKGYIRINNFDQKGDRMNIDVKVAN